MSNTATIIKTKFTNLDEPESENSTSYGWRIFDNYGKGYANIFTLEELPEDDLEFLKFVVKNTDDDDGGVLAGVIESETGIEVNGTWFDWDQIKEIVS
jgi:hypothetical protein